MSKTLQRDEQRAGSGVTFANNDKDSEMQSVPNKLGSLADVVVDDPYKYVEEQKHRPNRQH